MPLNDTETNKGTAKSLAERKALFLLVQIKQPTVDAMGKQNAFDWSYRLFPLIPRRIRLNPLALNRRLQPFRKARLRLLFFGLRSAESTHPQSADQQAGAVTWLRCTGWPDHNSRLIQGAREKEKP